MQMVKMLFKRDSYCSEVELAAGITLLYLAFRKMHLRLRALSVPVWTSLCSLRLCLRIISTVIAAAVILCLNLTGVAQISLVALCLVANVFRGVVDVLLGFSVTWCGDALVGLLVGHCRLEVAVRLVNGLQDVEAVECCAVLL